ncbi:PREDICTED: molybdenum cofactor sulfurase isoform X1 [Theobroma cacao]|uniref:Molybdenum cofactor sulfurase isoform X1 n=1 Tax=Theobroma cacao TaxID=3641 RepID=A0AB32W5N5_THECC|nr:PREDICTED: molybdenum cofactor sulfurase isoform X1 [Theobroma cacao]
MHSPCLREASQACYGCCLNPFPGLPESRAATSQIPRSAAASRYEFEVCTASSLCPNFQFTNHESLPSSEESFSYFIKVYPQYSQTDQADKIRAQEYYHLSLSKHVCLDYIGHGLFSYSQLESQCPGSPAASSSSSPPPPPPVRSVTLEAPFFDISYKSVNLNSQILYGGEESEFESNIRKRIMAFMNISEADYTMVLSANQSSASKLLAESYPFQSYQNLLTVYDYQSEAVEVMIESSKKRGANVMSANFSWPNLSIQSEKLRKKIANKSKHKKKGLFVFPLQSRVTGSRYSYLWMSLAQENGWHVLLDASALGAKDMETLGLSLFNPDFLICSFFKVFGENPSGFCCLFIRKSSASVLKDSTTATSIGIVNLVPASEPTRISESSAISSIETRKKSKEFPAQGSFSGPISIQQRRDETTLDLHKTEGINRKQKTVSFSEIEEVIETSFESASSIINNTSQSKNPKIECRSLDHADSLGLILISSRTRNLINWLVNALMSLQHPHSENGIPAVKIYGPKIMFDRGPAVAFNVFDWKGEKIDPVLVQKLADRNNISLSIGFLQHIWFSDKHEEEKEKQLETRTSEAEEPVSSKKRDKFHSGISVVTAALGFLTNFEDIYRLWAFVSRFLDADFLEKEKWRYKALNQKTIEI